MIKQFGGWIFRYRDYTPVPILVFLLLESRFSWSSFLIGVCFTLFGEMIRFNGVVHIGAVSRTRKLTLGAQLVETGPFGVSRNPLYIGNFFIALGVVFLTGVYWFVPLYVILFFVQYYPIVIWEEANLLKTFGDTYINYCHKIPRWIPRSGFRDLLPPNWGYFTQNEKSIRDAIRSERNTLLAILLVSILFGIAGS